MKSSWPLGSFTTNQYLFGRHPETFPAYYQLQMTLRSLITESLVLRIHFIVVGCSQIELTAEHRIFYVKKVHKSTAGETAEVLPFSLARCVVKLSSSDSEKPSSSFPLTRDPGTRK
eukprot:m.72343 g.72343  ORF g.72343 m.72343 type:complete len:116 (+) comp35792_c1_seq2:139-486(+)